MKKYLRSDIQGLRAIAVLLVMLFHFQLLTTGGFIGVDVFFVISGYVIISTLARKAIATEGRINLIDFYVRRGLRLLPAVAVMSFITVVLSAILYSPLSALPDDTSRLGVGTSLWIANFILYAYTGGYFDNAAESLPLTHTWSLSVEEQFYFVIPFVLVATWFIFKRFKSGTSSFSEHKFRFVWLVVICLVGVITLLVNIDLSFIHSSNDVLSLSYYASFTRAWEFCVGGALALTPDFVSLDGKIKKGIQALGLIIIFVSSFLIDSSMVFPGYVALLPVIGAAITIKFGDVDDSLPILNNPIAKHLGDISYSLYLWHWPIWVFASYLYGDNLKVRVFCLVSSYFAGIASYYLIEERFRRRGSRLDRKTLPILLSAILIPLLTSSSVLVLTDRDWFSASLAKQKQASYEWWVCDGEQIDIGESVICQYPNPSGAKSKPIYLVGDSNIEMYVPLFLEESKKHGFSLTVLHSEGCPFSYAIYKQAVNSCDRYSEKTVDWLKHQAPGIVVYSTTFYSFNDFHGLMPGHNKDFAEDGNQPQKTYKEGLRRFLEDIKAAGHQVDVLETLDYNSELDYSRDCSWLEIGSNLNKCAKTVRLSQTSEGTKEWNSLVKETAEKSGARFIQTNDLICPDGVCTTIKDSHFLFRDGRHITPYYATHLQSLFNRIISSE